VSLGRSGLSRKSDTLRYNVFTGEYCFEFNLDLKRNSIRIKRDQKANLTVRAFSSSGSTELMKTPPAQMMFSTCPICVLACDRIIYTKDDDGDMHRKWPPENFGHNERKAKHPNNVKVNLLNGHVREDLLDVEQRKIELQNVDSPIYHKKRKLHDSIIRNVSKAALFNGDWYGSAVMRSLTYSPKAIFFLTTEGGGIWPESLIVMIVNVYLRYEESISYLMISTHDKLEYGGGIKKASKIAEEYKEDLVYNGKKQNIYGDGYDDEKRRGNSSIRSLVSVGDNDDDNEDINKESAKSGLMKKESKKDDDGDGGGGCLLS
jgi:hypothetical protein